MITGSVHAPVCRGSREVRKVRGFNAEYKRTVLLCGKLGLELCQTFSVLGRTQRIDQFIQFPFDDAV